MTRCHSCGAISNNRFYCRGCGRSLEAVQVCPAAERKREVNFLNEVVKTIETVYPEERRTEKIRVQQPSVDMAKLVDSSSIFIVDSERCRRVEGEDNYRAMLLDMGVTVAVPMLFSIGASFILGCSAAMGLKIYFVSYFLVSFLMWFVFPFIFESSPMALIMRDYTLIKGAVGRLKGDLLVMLILWITSLLYSFLPLLLFEYAVSLLYGKHYFPFMFQVAGVKYVLIAK